MNGSSSRESRDEYRRKLFGETEQLTPEERTRREDIVGWIYKLVPKKEEETHDEWVERVIQFLNDLEN
jgi:hypothetical protein